MLQTALISTVLVGCMYGVSTVYVQCLYRAYTVLVQCLYGTSTVHRAYVESFVYGVNHLQCRVHYGDNVIDEKDDFNKNNGRTTGVVDTATNPVFVIGKTESVVHSVCNPVNM